MDVYMYIESIVAWGYLLLYVLKMAVLNICISFATLE